MTRCGKCGTTDAKAWWAGKSSEWVCQACGLQGHALKSVDQIREKIGAMAPTVTRAPEGGGSYHTKDAGMPAGGMALDQARQAAALIEAAMRAMPPAPEGTRRLWETIWANIWSLAGVRNPPPLPSVAAAGKSSPDADSTKDGGGGSGPRKFSPGAGLTKVIAALETGSKGEPAPSGRKRFDPGAGLKELQELQEPDPADPDRRPRFQVV